MLNLMFLLPILLFSIAVSLCIGILVYRYARTRGMPALLWAIVAALVPSFLGVIIYLLVRGSHLSLRCPHCGASVGESDLFCWHCAQSLQPKAGKSDADTDADSDLYISPSIL